MKKSNKSEPKSQSVNPLTDTLQTVPGMPTKLKIYKVAISPYWWTRVYVDGRYRMKSLKTEKLKEAHKAQDLAGIEAHMATLNAAWTAASEDMYKATQGGAQPGSDAGPGAGSASNAATEDVTDVPFEEVK